MSKFTIIIVFILAGIVSSCSSVSKISKQAQDADLAFANGDMETAYNLYTSYIQQQESANVDIAGTVFANAGKAAYAINKFQESEKLLKQAYYKNYADADMYANLIRIYKNIDNLSKEIDALSFFAKNYPNDPRFEEFSNRLLATYIESENWEKAVELYNGFDINRKANKQLMEFDFIALQKLKNTVAADKIATNLLKLDVQNKLALEWMAEKFFFNAENRYQKELELYEKNKTNKQYNLMLKALDIVTADFKKSLKYYEMLYKLYPAKEYAKQIANIYTRFQDKQKADYYKKLAQ
ncbi:MAG: hypothetical protein JW729_09410 [Bacteroidales bacterium]|nr:hypothetical protein [Bacteroidales bacterium]